MLLLRFVDFLLHLYTTTAHTSVGFATLHNLFKQTRVQLRARLAFSVLSFDAFIYKQFHPFGTGQWSQNTTNKVVEYLLLQHVSALALGHHQVSNCASEEATQCSIRVAHTIQRDLVDNVTIDNCQEKIVL